MVETRRGARVALAAMPEESLLTDEVRALAGREVPLGRVRVTPRAYRRAHEVYVGGLPARVPAEGEQVPGYVITALESEAEQEAPAFPALLPDSLLIANEWRFERPLRMGEELAVIHRVTGVRERFGGRFGYSIDILSEVCFIDAEGRLVAASGRTMTQYAASGSPGE